MTQLRAHDCGRPCDRPTFTSEAANAFDLEPLEPGCITMSRVMQRAAEEPMMEAILEADRAPVAQARLLNGNNRNGNVYGFVNQGVYPDLNVVGRVARANNQSLAETFRGWVTTLTELFPAMPEYDKESLGQRIVDLDAAAEKLEALVARVIELGNHHDPGFEEVYRQDFATWAQIIEGLRSGRDGLEGLYEKVFCADTKIDTVKTDIPPQNH